MTESNENDWPAGAGVIGEVAAVDAVAGREVGVAVAVVLEAHRARLRRAVRRRDEHLHRDRGFEHRAGRQALAAPHRHLDKEILIIALLINRLLFKGNLELCSHQQSAHQSLGQTVYVKPSAQKLH